MSPPSAWDYISKVTLRDAWEELKGVLAGTIALGIFALLLIAIPYGIIYFTGAHALVSDSYSEFSDFAKSIPWWIVAPALISAFFWLARGQRFRFPQLDFKLWLIVAVTQFVAFAGFAFLPWWLMAPAYYVITSPLLYLDRLIEIGREKLDQEQQTERNHG